MDNSTGAKRAQMAISQQPEQQQKRSQVINLLTVLAEARQASISEQTLLVYSKALCEFELRAIEKAVNRLSLRERRDGETAFPDLATLLKEVKAQAENVKVSEMRLPAEIQKKLDEDEASMRRLEAGEIPGERLDGLLAQVCDPSRDRQTQVLAMPGSKRRLSAPQAQAETYTCPHCENVASPQKSEDIARLILYYQRRHELAKHREEQEAAKQAGIEDA